MDTLIPWLCALKSFQSKKKLFCYLKKLKHYAFPQKFPICLLVAKLVPIIIASFSRQRKTLCSVPTEPKLQLRDEILEKAAVQQYRNFVLWFLSIISNHSSFPFPGKENQRGKLNILSQRGKEAEVKSRSSKS